MQSIYTPKKHKLNSSWNCGLQEDSCLIQLELEFQQHSCSGQIYSYSGTQYIYYLLKRHFKN